MNCPSSSFTSFDRCVCGQTLPTENIAGVLEIALDSSRRPACLLKDGVGRSTCERLLNLKQNTCYCQHPFQQTCCYGCATTFSVSRSLCLTPECCPVRSQKQRPQVSNLNFSSELRCGSF